MEQTLDDKERTGAEALRFSIHSDQLIPYPIQKRKKKDYFSSPVVHA
jgi:hypothetical protein